MKQMSFQRFLKESFENEVYTRELRLSPGEVEWIKKKFPEASLTPTSEHQSSKAWYEVRLRRRKERESVHP